MFSETWINTVWWFFAIFLQLFCQSRTLIKINFSKAVSHPEPRLPSNLQSPCPSLLVLELQAWTTRPG